SDAVAALTRVQAAQERLRAQHGLYSNDFGVLQVAATSSEGLYRLELELTGPDSYRARAIARADGAQAADHDCATLLLNVNSGFAQTGPSTRCWNR
ncbi:MAG: type IV pilin protein, partial [Rubrivivax sp.]